MTATTRLRMCLTYQERKILVRGFLEREPPRHGCGTLGAVASTILITGSNRGLGLCIAERFAAAGWCVIATSLDTSERPDALARSRPDQVMCVALDVTNAASIAAAKTRILESHDSIDVLVNNAAILPPEGRGELGGLDFEAGMRMLDVNTLGPLRVSEAFVPLIERSERRLIVNISSEAGSVGDCWRKDDYFYCMSKAALNMQSAILQNALGDRDIRLLALHPGWMRTEMGGANADIDPAEASDGIFALVARCGELRGLYFDYRGMPMRW